MYGCSILCTFRLSKHLYPTLVRIIDVPPYTIKFHCQNEVVFGGLLLLAAFSQPIGNPYEWSGSIMELGRGLSVTLKHCGVEQRPLLSLHYHFSWLSALCGPYQGLFHPFTFIWHFSWIACPPSGPPLLNSPDTTISGPTSVKVHLNWWENDF